MSNTVVLNEHIYNLLIVMDLDHFTVNELVNVLENEESVDIDKDRLTKLAYRQIRMLEKKTYLKKSKEKRARSIVYSKTSNFENNLFVSRLSNQSDRNKQALIFKRQSSADFYDELSREKGELEAHQIISLREMEKYKELLERYPNERAFIEPFYLKARIQSANIQGDLEAVSKLLLHYQ